MGDAGGTDGTDNNFDSKNTYTKACFSIYNIVDVNVDADDISGTRDADDISGMKNNANGKNAYIQAGFSIYNFAGVGAGDTSDIGQEVSNNINNTDIGQLGRVSEVNKDELGETNAGGLDGTNKDEVNEANIEAGKKADVKAVASTDNSVDSGGKITD